jgi:hypothetical protein
VNASQPSHDEIDESYRSSITTVFEQANPHPDWQLEFVRGDAGPVLVREAKDAQLLVVGDPRARRARPIAGRTNQPLLPGSR